MSLEDWMLGHPWTVLGVAFAVVAAVGIGIGLPRLPVIARWRGRRADRLRHSGSPAEDMRLDAGLELVPIARPAVVEPDPVFEPDDTTSPDLVSEETPPPGYVPLEMPELWEPPAEYPPIPELRQPAPAVGSDHPQPVPTTPMTASAPRPAPAQAAPHPSTPRTLNDLRTGPLRGRTFASHQELAVAAVVEAGYPIPVVARLFRFPMWRLEEWVSAARSTMPPPR